MPDFNPIEDPAKVHGERPISTPEISSERPTRNSQHDTGEGHERFARGTYGPGAELSYEARVASAPVVEGSGHWISSWRDKWARRAITIPGLILLSACYALVMPLILLVCPVMDFVRGRRQLLIRFHIAFFAILVWHIIGVAGLFWVWLTNRAEAKKNSDDWINANRRFETFWVDEVIGLSEAIYDVTFDVQGLEELREGPFLILSRHVSVIDAILPNRILSKAHGTVIRNVIKQELLVDPCVDITSHRIPRTFVQRGSGNVDEQLQRMVSVMGGMDENDAVLVFPEGTRFSSKKLKRVMTKLRDKRPELARLTESLECVLPPRPAGAFALMDAKPDMDVVFCAHTGLEGAGRLENLLAGALLDKTIHVRFWRVKAKDIPVDSEQRLEWLCSWWGVVDRWIQAHSGPE